MGFTKYLCYDPIGENDTHVIGGVESRFTKRHFVWHKNTQTSCKLQLLQFFTVDTNMESILRLRQRFWLNFDFHFSSRFYLLFFCVFLLIANFIEDHTTSTTSTFAWSQCDVTRSFCCFEMANEDLANINSLKWKLATIWRSLIIF